MKNKRAIILFVLLPLTLGGLFYYFYCPEVFWVKKADEILKTSIHFKPMGACAGIIVFCRNYLLDLLWAYALAAVIYLILDSNVLGILWSIAGASLLGLFLEMLQWTEMAPGTFDGWDILAECTGAAMGAFTIKKSSRRKENEKK